MNSVALIASLCTLIIAGLSLYLAIKANKTANKAITDYWVDVDDAIVTDKVIKAKGFIEHE